MFCCTLYLSHFLWRYSMWVFSTSRLAHTITIENIIKSSWTASGHHRDPLNFHSLEFQLINIALWPHLTHSTRELNDFAEYHHVWVWRGRSGVRLCTGRHWLSPIANKGCNCVDSRPHHKQISIKFKFTCFSVSLSQPKSNKHPLNGWADTQTTSFRFCHHFVCDIKAFSNQLCF